MSSLSSSLSSSLYAPSPTILKRAPTPMPGSSPPAASSSSSSPSDDAFEMRMPSIDHEMELAHAKQQLASKEARITHLLRQLEAERALLSVKIQECNGYAERFRSLQGELDRSVGIATHLQTEASEAQEKLTAVQEELAASTEKNTLQTRMLKKAHEDSRAVVTENAMLKENLRVANLDLEEMRAKYGMLGDLGDERVRRAIDRGRDAMQENNELRQRLIGKNLQVTELSERYSQLKEEVDPLVDQTQTLVIAKQELMGDNRQLKAQVESLQQAARKLRSQKQQLKSQVTSGQEELRLYSEEKSAGEEQVRLAQREAEAVTSRIEVLQRERTEQMDAMQLAMLRQQLMQKDLEIAREEKKAKDKQIRELRDNLSYLNQKVLQLMPHASSGDASAPPILAPHLEDDPSIRKLREQLELSISACRAHQSQNAFLAQEFTRLEREKTAHLELKDRTIQRLSRDLEVFRASITVHAGSASSDLSLNGGNSSSTLASSSSSSMSSSTSSVDDALQTSDGRNGEVVAAPRSMLGVVASAPLQASLEMMHTEMEELKKTFFFTLVQSIKLSAMQAGTPITADATELFEALQQQNVPYPRWSEWIHFQLDNKRGSTRSFVSPKNRWVS